MVKTKDFAIGTKKLAGGFTCLPPCPTQLPPMLVLLYTLLFVA